MWTDIPTWQEWQNASAAFRPRVTAKPWLKKVDTWIRRYHFTGRPVDSLKHLRQAISEWSAERFGKPLDPAQDKAQLDLAAVVKKKWKQLTRLNPGYTEVALIAYETKLFGQKDVDSSGASKSDKDDISARWAQMKKAIEKAHQALPREHRDNKHLLKLFMAPEFYFRGKSGAYDMAQFFPEFIDKVPEFTKAYPDWLFVLGTFVCSWTTDEQRVDRTDFLGKLFNKKKTVKTGGTVENYALVQKGGYSSRDHIHDVQVGKEFPSHIDFSHPGDGKDWYAQDRKAKILGGEIGAQSPPGSREFSPEMRTGNFGGKDAYMGPLKTDGSGELEGTLTKTTLEHEDESAAFGCVFTMDGITFGLEVCRDHLLGRLVHAADHAAVQLQLIPSWGASISKDGSRNHVVPNAVAFNVDGARGDAAVFDPRGAIASFFTKPLTQNTKYFPKDAKIVGYGPVAIPRAV